MSKSNQAFPRNENNPILPWIIIFSILLVICSGILVYLLREHEDASKGVDYSLSLSADAGFDCDFSEAQRLFPFEDGLMKLTSNRISFLTLSGNETFSIDVSMQAPFLDQSGAYFVVADQGGFAFALFNKDGPIYQNYLDSKISCVAVSDNGMVAIIAEEKDSFGSVCIIDRSGNLVAKWSSRESGYPISLSFSPDNSLINIGLVDTNRSQIKPSIKQLYIPDDLTKDSIYEYAYYAPQSASIMPQMVWLDNDRFLVAGIESIESVIDQNIQPIETQFANIIYIMPAHDNICVVYSDGIGQTYKASFLNSSLEITNTIDLGNQVKAFSSYGDHILFAVDNRLLYYNVRKHNVDTSLNIDEEVIRISLRDKKKSTIVTATGVREISF
ncbi:MAG: hypothetical protein GXY06_01970 [Clostridiaceae bacterium]|nr:hypothetical protein [Clostridiaceae bacterium]